jgi:hypothetical protein
MVPPPPLQEELNLISKGQREMLASFVLPDPFSPKFGSVKTWSGIAGTAERAAYIRAVTVKARQAMKLTWLIILSVCFLVGSSIASAQFLLRTCKSRVTTGFLTALILAIVGWAIWMLLPFVGQ